MLPARFCDKRSTVLPVRVSRQRDTGWKHRATDKFFMVLNV